MNIFVLDSDPVIAGSYHCDKHVLKMIIESAQLLSNSHHQTGKVGPYRLTHKNHPCTKWVMESISNYRWLVKMGKKLAEEYTSRYGKIHKVEEKIKYLEFNEPNLPDNVLTKFKQAMPNEYKNEDPVKAYRDYYIYEKSRFAKWKNNNVPGWYINK